MEGRIVEMKLSFDDICGGAEQVYNCADVDRVMYSIRNQLRKGWDFRVAALVRRQWDIQDEIDFEENENHGKYFHLIDCLKEKHVRVKRRAAQALAIKNPWKV